MDKKNVVRKGDKGAFDKNWGSRTETQYIHWTRGTPQNQIQLAFRNHWILFQEIMAGRNLGKRILEVGCGRGTMSAYFADNGFVCTLLDSSKSAIDTAQKFFLAQGLKADFDVGDAMNLPYNPGSFDIVFSIGLLEHFDDIATPLIEQIRVLSKRGLFLGYVVPQYKDNIQKHYSWINDLLKAMADTNSIVNNSQKEEVFRSDADSSRYIKELQKLAVRDINASGVYPLPMISYSIEFPFTLLNSRCEQVLVEHFQAILDDRKEKTGKNPWLCDEGYGQAFLVWCFKK